MALKQMEELAAQALGQYQVPRCGHRSPARAAEIGEQCADCGGFAHRGARLMLAAG